MIAEAIQAIEGLARAATAPKPLDIKDPRKARFVDGSGRLVEFSLPPPPRAHTVKQLDDLIALAKRFETIIDDDGDCKHLPVVFYDESAVVLVIDDDGHRCETATLKLEESDLFRAVRALGSGCAAKAFGHKDFVRLLRIDLAGALDPGTLLDIVQRVKFENGTVTSAEVRKSRESLGREITSAVSAEKDIPDTVVLSVPVYKTLGERETYPVRCTVEIDSMSAVFRLVPFPDEIENTLQLAVGSIADRLAGGLPESVPSYFGKP